MNTFKKTLLKAVCAILMISFIPVTGCSKFEDFKENLESRSAQRKEDNKRRFGEMHEFQDYYDKEIKKALKNNDKAALMDLFCETVIENTYDLDEGLKYVFEMEDWSEFTYSKGQCSNSKEYGSEIWSFVNCWSDLTKGDKKYRVFFDGYAIYEKKDGSRMKTSKEDLGLTNFCISKLGKDGKVEEPVHDVISGIRHPGRDKLELIVNTVLDTYESKDKDGSYIDTMTDEALGSIMTDNLKKSADKDELEAFIKFIRLGSMSKKNEYYFFLNEKGGAVTLTNVVHFKLNDHCLTLLLKNDQIDGATFSDDGNPGKPQSGRIKGFAELVD